MARQPKNPVIQGILLMLLAALGFAIMNVIIRYSAAQLHPFQMAFFRNIFGLLFMMPWLITQGLGALKTGRIGLYLVRAALGLTSMLCWFWGLTQLPLAKAVALSFSVPIFVTLGAVLFLGERIFLRRILAVIIGFIGTLIILRPQIDGDLIPSLVVLFSAMTMAASVLIIKRLSETESSNAIVVYMVLLIGPMSLPPAIAVWQWPDPFHWMLMVALGGMGTLGHLAFTNALRVSDVSVVMPIDFMRLPFTILFAWLILEQQVDQYTLLGGLIVFTSTAYISRREALHQRQLVLASSPHRISPATESRKT